MPRIRLSSPAPRSPKTAALALFTTASERPETADWRAIAEQLAAILTTAPKRRVANADGFAMWSDRDPAGKLHPFHVIRATFADGVVVETSLMIPADGRPANIARACRVACDFYRSRVRRMSGAADIGGYGWSNCYPIATRTWDLHVTVPPFTSIECLDLGLVWSPESATAATVDRRAGSWSLAEVRAEAIDAGMSEAETAEWIRETFEAEALADLKRRRMIDPNPGMVSDRVRLHRAILAGEVEPPHITAQREARERAEAEARGNVLPFRRPASALARRMLSSVAIRAAVLELPPAA